MSMQGKKTSELYKKAAQYIPHGVNSNFRYWGPDDTLVISRGQGAYIWDADDKKYIDYRLGFGPIILGHREKKVDDAVHARQSSAVPDRRQFRRCGRHCGDAGSVACRRDSSSARAAGSMAEWERERPACTRRIYGRSGLESRAVDRGRDSSRVPGNVPDPLFRFSKNHIPGDRFRGDHEAGFLQSGVG